MADIAKNTSMDEAGEMSTRYFIDESEVTEEEYDAALVTQAEELAVTQAAAQAASDADMALRETRIGTARTKLLALGLTNDEITALIGGS